MESFATPLALRGGIYDVALDLRPRSPNFGKCYATELTGKNGLALFIAKGCAQGFQTLCQNCDVFCLVDSAYDSKPSRGVRRNDPKFAIQWPEEPPPVISDNDPNLPDY